MNKKQRQESEEADCADECGNASFPNTHSRQYGPAEWMGPHHRRFGSTGEHNNNLFQQLLGLEARCPALTGSRSENSEP